MKAKSLVWLNILALLATLFVNYLSNSLPLNGKNPAQLSDELPNLFVPAGRTFAIWGIIYTWLIVFNIWQLTALRNNKSAQIVEKLGFGFIITCILNIAWIFAWHWQLFIPSVLVMIGLFLSLTQLNLKLKTGFEKFNSSEKWLIHAPFGIYWGWISVALIANVTASFVGFGWSGGEAAGFIAATMVLIGTLIAVYVVYFKNNIFYGLAVAWAVFGIYSKRILDTSSDSNMVASVALFGLVLLLAVVALRTTKWFIY